MSESKRVVRHYLIEFKVDAVKLLEEQGYTVSEAANRLGVPQANLTKWRKHFLRSPPRDGCSPATSGHNRPPKRPSCGACRAR